MFVFISTQMNIYTNVGSRTSSTICIRSVMTIVRPMITRMPRDRSYDDTEGQILSRKLGWCPMQNQWVARWLGREEGPPDRQETVGRGKRWESASTPFQWYDPQPLPSVPGTPQVGRDFYLDEPCSVKGFVSVTPTSLAWKDRAGGADIKL